jgi:hypothetical protein
VSVLEPPGHWWVGQGDRVVDDKEPATFLVWIDWREGMHRFSDWKDVDGVSDPAKLQRVQEEDRQGVVPHRHPRSGATQGTAGGVEAVRWVTREATTPRPKACECSAQGNALGIDGLTECTPKG